MEKQIRLGQIAIDRLAFEQALDCIEALVRAGRGGVVFTPNVDHVVQAETSAAFRDAYARADLRLADGMPLLWAARLLGAPLPAKVSGSDLILPLMDRAARAGLRVYLLGGAPGVGERAAAVLRARGVTIAGVDAPFVSDPRSERETAPIVERIRQAGPDLVVVGLGAPKQELFIDAVRAQIAPAVALGLGASIDFVAGTVRRAPPWMSAHGLEWLYRLWREPRRLWRRYLLRDPRFAAIVWRSLCERRALPAPA